ncbi:UMP kinase [Hornefia butyriciproducens]|jgi:uridylate kinase|uniref:Uridylate kinase n=1 Tax=Hornefia butyriciproducens TaxID=2652293 RepID=A0A6L5Y2M2_9FIRM|nr:UMP kinase [Hornefia butyriciproducens]MCI7327878.1 UMP kinase [Clostridiales bacterium]MCI7412410.1 UMP kinase [Clostridiales bacterium]MCI7679935.1 UMP kinase [Clostridiales bacterium]MDD6299870.1 UMP kinase [Hornefia butyriciproducens]MDY2989944.1 UMP kinase [Hornefia butyriciproducens]
MEPKYKRVLLKISGEALAGETRTGINEDMTNKVAREIKQLIDLGVEVAIVVGGGNFWRGRSSKDMNRETADYIGMLATVMNSLALQDALLAQDVPARVQTSIEMRKIAEPYIWRRALKELGRGEVVIFGGGIGEPHFSTDTAAALRAVNIGADMILLAKNIDAVYSDDPKTNPDAVKYTDLAMKDVIDRGLKVMDLTAATICMENNMRIQVFGLAEENSMVRAVCGENIGTLIK